jgi:hypothetical protein
MLQSHHIVRDKVLLWPPMTNEQVWCPAERNQLFHAYLSRNFLLTASLRWWKISTHISAFTAHHSEIFVSEMIWISTYKPVFSSLLPYYTFLQTFVISLKEICIAKENFMFAHCSVTDIFNATNKQLTMTTMRKMLPLWSDDMNATNSWHWNMPCSFSHLKKVSDSSIFLRLLHVHFLLF